jgi:hypothetical protein
MSAPTQAPTQAAASTQLVKPVNTGILQRKCACGSTPGITGVCSGCQEKRLALQRSALDRPAPAAHLSLRGDSSSVAASSAATDFVPAAAHSFGSIQVHPPAPDEPADSNADEKSEQPPQSDAAESPAPPPEVSSPKAQAGPVGLIVDDQAREPTPEQMRKTEFLDELERSVCAAADAELTAVGRTAQGCPYISTWIGYYRSREGSHVERALRRYAPEAAGARNAREYIPFVAARVRRAAAVWAATGEITGVPEEIAASLSGSTPGAMVSAAGSVLSSFAGGLVGIFTKAKEGGARRPDDPEQIRSELQNGRPLDTAVRARMESAFAHDFSGVRVHTDGRAAAASNRINARAFTIGSDVAFGAGEYHPGTIVGDALLAHELAHVVQQRGAVTSAAPMAMSDGMYNSLEENADEAAANAVISLWGGAKAELRSVRQKSIPRSTSGLSLQRCGKKETCSAGDKTVTVDLVKLRDSTGTPATDLAEANKLWKKCCVQFVTGQDPVVPDALSDKWLGDTDLTSSGECGALSGEEKAMFDGATTKYSLSSRIKVFYVKSFTIPPPDAYAYTCNSGHYDDYVVVQNDPLKDTLAHEFGHLLLESSDHKGIDSPGDTKNLMFAPGRTGSDVDASQCKVAYNNV